MSIENSREAILEAQEPQFSGSVGNDSGKGRASKRMRSVRTLVPRTTSAFRTLAIAVVFIVLALYFQVRSGSVFLSATNVNYLFRQLVVLGIMSAGTAVIMIMGEIDLSIGSAIYLTGLVAAKANISWHFPLALTFAAAIAVGLILGIWQGFWVSFVGVPSFIVTLGGLLMFRGIGQDWSNAVTFAPVSSSITQLTEASVPPMIVYVGIFVSLVVGVISFTRDKSRRDQNLISSKANVRLFLWYSVLVVILGISFWLSVSQYGIPTSALWLLGIGGLLWILMGRTGFGREAYLIGANRRASAVAGVSVKSRVFAGFLLSGVMYGIGGVLLTARLDGSNSTAGTNYELLAIAAAVLGGISLKGGLGTIQGAIVGAVLLTVIQNGMDLTNTSTFLQAIVEAGILIMAVALDVVARRRAES